jgi:hypothetical protein
LLSVHTFVARKTPPTEFERDRLGLTEVCAMCGRGAAVHRPNDSGDLTAPEYRDAIVLDHQPLQTNGSGDEFFADTSPNGQVRKARLTASDPAERAIALAERSARASKGGRPKLTANARRAAAARRRAKDAERKREARARARVDQ